jgi:glycerol-3-phosphate acyltransferase PlsY
MMSAVLGLLVGVLAGSAPTAVWLGRWRGLDLREQGSGNPGAANAFRLGGPVLGAVVLITEVGKGWAAVWLGASIGGPPAAALAGMGATLGNSYNPWYGLSGGKGLAITAGTLGAAWPILAAVLVVVIGAGAATLRRSGPAALLALSAHVILAVVGVFTPLPGRWMIDHAGWLLTMAAVQSLAMAPKHYADAVTPPDRRGFPAGS